MPDFAYVALARTGQKSVGTLTASSEDIHGGDIHQVEPSVQALRRLVEEEVAP